MKERERENMRVESIVVGMEVSRWEGYNERLAISSINIFHRFVMKDHSCWTATGRRSLREDRDSIRCHDLEIIRNDVTTKCLTCCQFFLPHAESRFKA